MTWCLHAFLILYELERTISHSNLTTSKHRENKQVQTAFLYGCILELPHFKYGCLVGQPRRGGGRGGEGGDTDEQPLSDKPLLIRCGETYCTWQ